MKTEWMRRERDRPKQEVNKEERDPTQRRQLFHPLSSGKFTERDIWDGIEENNTDSLEKGDVKRGICTEWRREISDV